MKNTVKENLRISLYTPIKDTDKYTILKLKNKLFLAKDFLYYFLQNNTAQKQIFLRLPLFENMFPLYH